MIDEIFNMHASTILSHSILYTKAMVLISGLGLGIG